MYDNKIRQSNKVKMTGGNDTIIMEFTLLGLFHYPELQPLLFLAFLTIYILILMGNALVILVTVYDPVLHTPMYFFLRNLAFLEICYTSVTIPKMLANLLLEKKTISFSGCATQMYFFLFFGTAVCYLLAVISYDRYVAICNPLHYPVLMSRRLCLLLVSGCWVTGMSVSLGQTALIFSVPFCGSNVINHFFCDVPPLVKLLCPDSHVNEVTKVLMNILVIIIPFTLILASYICIVTAILRIPSLDGKRKAIHTCSSHLVSVSLFYGSAVFRYLRPNSGYTSGLDKLLSLLYTVAPALLNPVIYSLRNQRVKAALRKSIQRTLGVHV
ncbi:olfactory receptor 10A2-like [Gopherus flavomarginatus]|uniref:olfactory receptor 10A2-like n=1 Tax=Gopherus flavomarginatus TaxID=286002 RepID=UPI0021CC3A34|nr:olfactory receptor 10A2-like [Gopherus flavomarginatus]